MTNEFVETALSILSISASVVSACAVRFGEKETSSPRAETMWSKAIRTIPRATSNSVIDARRCQSRDGPLTASPETTGRAVYCARRGMGFEGPAGAWSSAKQTGLVE